MAAGSTDKVFPDIDFALARYNIDGSLDITFGAGGKVTTNFQGSSNDRISKIALQTDGRLVVAGESNIDVTGVFGDNFALARYNIDGSLDIDFGSSGKVVTDFFDQDDFATSVAIQADGRIVAAGPSKSGTSFSSYNFALARYNTNGSLDATFGIEGKVVTDFFGDADFVSGIAIQTDGRILAAGQTNTEPSGFHPNFALARYLSGPVMQRLLAG